MDILGVGALFSQPQKDGEGKWYVLSTLMCEIEEPQAFS